MADNPERLAQIMQRMQVSNQRTLGNRFGGGYSGTSSANAPTPPSQQIDFSQNTLSPPSMAEPDDTGPGQQMPSVIQPPAPSPMGMPSGGNAYLGNQQSASPSTRDLYSLPDYSGKMGGGIGGGFDIGRLLKLLSNYMGSQMAPPSAAPTPAPVEATPPSIDQSELQKPVEYTGGSQLPAPSPAPTPAPSPSPDMPVNEYQPGYVPYTTQTPSPGALPSQYKSVYAPPPVPAGIKAPDPGSMHTSVMGEMYNPNTGQRYTTRSGGYSAEPGSGWVSQGQPGYVAGTPGQATPDMRNKFGQPAQPSSQLKGLTYPKPGQMVDMSISTLYNPETGEYASGGGGVYPEPGSAWRQATYEESKLRPSRALKG